MTYKLKITQDKKEYESVLKDLKELSKILEKYQDKPFDVEIHKVKVYKNENK